MFSTPMSPGELDAPVRPLDRSARTGRPSPPQRRSPPVREHECPTRSSSSTRLRSALTSRARRPSARVARARGRDRPGRPRHRVSSPAASSVGIASSYACLATRAADPAAAAPSPIFASTEPRDGVAAVRAERAPVVRPPRPGCRGPSRCRRREAGTARARPRCRGAPHPPPGRAREPAVVVREISAWSARRLRACLLHPLRRGYVLLGPRRPRDLLIRHIANKGVPERELVLALQSTRPATGRTNSRRSKLARPRRDLVARTSPSSAATAPAQNDAPDDGGVLEECLQLRRERVEPRGRSSACTVSGTARLSHVHALDEHPRELLRVERIASRTLEQHGSASLPGSTVAVEEALESRAASSEDSG